MGRGRKAPHTVPIRSGGRKDRGFKENLQELSVEREQNTSSLEHVERAKAALRKS